MIIDVWTSGNSKNEEYRAILNDFSSSLFLSPEEVEEGIELEDGMFILEYDITLFINKILKRVKSEIIKQIENGRSK